MKLFDIIREAEDRLWEEDTFDLDFYEKTENVLAIIRAMGIVPHKRNSEHGHLHMLFAGTLVVANEYENGIDITTRQYEKFHDADVSTMFIRWLDNACDEYLLETKSAKNIAEGNLKVSEFLDWHIDNPWFNNAIVESKQELH